MKACLLVLLLTATTLAINTPRSTAQSASNKNSVDLHYYRQYRSNQHQIKRESREANEANRATHTLSPAVTFQKQQAVRAEAYKIKEKILDAKRENQQEEMKANRHVQAVKNEVNNFENKQRGTSGRTEQETLQQKMKINHAEKLRQVYSTRAAENEARAVTQTTRAEQNRYNNLAKWDHQQEQHYAGEAADSLARVDHTEKGVASHLNGTAKKLENIQKDLKAARKQRDVVHEKGEARIARLEKRQENVNERLQGGKALSHIGEADQVDAQNKNAAQSTFDVMPENVILEQDQSGNGKTLSEEVYSVDFKTPTQTS
jgi:hypothetical protein